jgi:hypothetical protein
MRRFAEAHEGFDHRDIGCDQNPNKIQERIGHYNIRLRREITPE